MKETSKYKKTLEVFHGRRDVFAQSFEKEDRTIGFRPLCKNRGKKGICKRPCRKCDNLRYLPLTDEVIERHIKGDELIGVYPLLKGDTTKLFVVDFDKHTIGKDKRYKPLRDAKAYRKAAKKLGLSAYIERSKSGKGYHVWIFFEHPIPSYKARQLGEIILSMAGIPKEDSSFCRFFPSQDNLTGQKLGNLIALPFWGKAKKKGNSVFLNPKDDWEPYKTRKDFYDGIKFANEETVDTIIAETRTSSDKELGKATRGDIQEDNDNWVTKVMGGVNEGKRNSTATRLAGHFLAKGLPPEEVKRILYDWNKRNIPPLEESEIDSVVDSIYSREQEKRDSQDRFFPEKRFNPMVLVDHIMQSNDIIHDGSGFYQYIEEGFWRREHDSNIGKKMVDLLEAKARKNYILDAMKMLEYMVYKDPQEVESYPLLLNMKNGMFNLSTMELLPHDKKYFSKVQLPISYDPEAKCPRWRKFHKEIFQDDSRKIKTVRDFAGYCLYPGTPIHKCLLFTGTGGNGKSVFVNVLMKLVGTENVASLQPSRLTDKFLLGTLKDKLLNVSSEIQGNKLENSVWRQVIAGDTVQADKKFGNPFSFRPIAKHIYSMNTTPIISDRTDAFVRRIIVVTFNVSYDDDTADINLEDKLTEELPGIFNWALKGLKRVLKNKKIYESPQTKGDKKSFLKAVDPILNFVEDRCTLRDSRSVKKTDLHLAFIDWCRNSNIRTMSKIKFYKQLLINNPSINEGRPKGGIRCFYGIGLK